MNVIDARADVFWMAFKGLPKKERQSVVERLLTDTEFMNDLIDIAALEPRCEELLRLSHLQKKLSKTIDVVHYLHK